MRPTADKVGVEFTEQEVLFVLAMEETLWERRRIDALPEPLQPRKLRLEMPTEAGHLAVDQYTAETIITLGAMTATLYLEQYQADSGYHEQLCRTSDMSSDAVQAHVHNVETLLEIDAVNHRIVHRFTADVSASLAESHCSIRNSH